MYRMYVCMYKQHIHHAKNQLIRLGLSPPDSVAAGLENLLFPYGEKQFGDFGTLAAVSAVTAGQWLIISPTATATIYHHCYHH